MFFRKSAAILCLSIFTFNVSAAAVEAVSSLPINGTAPFYIHGTPGKTVGCTVSRPPISVHPGDYVQVGDLIICNIMYVDKDQDAIQEPFYGIFGRKDTNNKDIDTYFLFTDKNNSQTKIPRTNIAEAKSYEGIDSDEDLGLNDVLMVFYSIQYRVQESDIGGKLGLNTAPLSQYGLPNVGDIVSTNDIFNQKEISQIPNLNDPWPIRPNTKLKVGIWNLKDIQTVIPKGYQPKEGTFPYGHSNSAAPKLGETYVAVIWYDNNENGLYDTNEPLIINPSAIGNKEFQYQWYLVGNNSDAQGSVTGNKEIPFDGATQDNIILPTTNAKAISQWPNLVSAGLPANEAGLQGFHLRVIVDRK